MLRFVPKAVIFDESGNASLKLGRKSHPGSFLVKLGCLVWPQYLILIITGEICQMAELGCKTLYTFFGRS